MAEREKDNNVPHIGEIYYSDLKDYDPKSVRVAVKEVTLTPKQMHAVSEIGRFQIVIFSILNKIFKLKKVKDNKELLFPK